MVKKAFVDVDGTLFNTMDFKARYFTFLDSLVVPPNRESTLYTYELSKGDGFYNVDRHIALMSAASSIPAFDFRKTIESFMRREAQQFIYPDAKSFLRRLGMLGYEILIATSGIDWFQEEKIPVDFYRFLSNVFVTQDATKVSVVGRFADPEKDDIVLFDDSAYVISMVKQIFPAVCAIQVARGDIPHVLRTTVFANSCVRNLEEALGAVIHRPR